MQTTSARSAELEHPFEAPEKLVGYRVCDPLDKKVGIAEEFFVNGGGEPEYVRVKVGLFGLRSVLLPVQSVAVDAERQTLVLR